MKFIKKNGYNVYDEGNVIIETVEHIINCGYVVCDSSLNSRSWNITNKESECLKCKNKYLKINNMNFFTQLSEIGIKDVTIEIKMAQDGSVCVITTPKTIAQDKGLKTLKPLIITASAQELDEGYFAAIVVPLQKTAGIFNNIESFEAQLAESNKNTEAAKKEKDAEKVKKEKIKKLEDNTKKYVETLKSPKHWVQRKEKIYEFINSIIELDSTNKYVELIKKELETQESKTLTGSLFEESVVDEHIEPVIEDLSTENEVEDQDSDDDTEEA